MGRLAISRLNYRLRTRRARGGCPAPPRHWHLTGVTNPVGHLSRVRDCGRSSCDWRPPAASWQNGLHLVTKDAPLVTICSR